MTKPCMFCRGDGGARRPCAEGLDRCASCAERLPGLLAKRIASTLEELGIKFRPASLDRLTVRVERSKSGSIGAATVGCGGPPKGKGE